jgi:hypothetical protein
MQPRSPRTALTPHTCAERSRQPPPPPSPPPHLPPIQALLGRLEARARHAKALSAATAAPAAGAGGAGGATKRGAGRGGAGGSAGAGGAAAAGETGEGGLDPLEEGVRKVALAFLYVTSGVLAGIERGVVADPNNSISKADMDRMSILPGITALLKTEAMHEQVDHLEKSFRPRHYGSRFTAFFGHPLITLVAGPVTFLTIAGGAAFFTEARWRPVVRKWPVGAWLETPPVLKPFTADVMFPLYVGCIVLVVVAMSIVYTILTVSAMHHMSPTCAKVHCLLASRDDDILRLFQAEPDVLSLRGGQLPAAANTVAAGGSAAAPAAAGGSGGGATEGSAASPPPPLTREESIAYWADSLGVSAADAAAMVDTVDQADALLARPAATGGAGVGSAAAAAAAASPHATAGGSGDAAAVSVQVPPAMLDTLESLFYRLEEVGEVELAAQIAARLNFLQQLQDSHAAAAAPLTDEEVDAAADGVLPTGGGAMASLRTGSTASGGAGQGV